MISLSTSHGFQKLGIALLASALFLSACGATPTTPAGDVGPFATFLQDIEPFNTADPIAVVETDQGSFAIELFKNQMPLSVDHFEKLALAQRYDSSSVYNVVNNFAVYLGDKSDIGAEAVDVQSLNLETHPDIHHDAAGVVGFVHQSGAQCVTSPSQAQCAQSALNSAKTFFYITLAAAPSLDGSYAAFGKVVKGMQIVKNLHKGNKITKITIVERK